MNRPILGGARQIETEVAELERALSAKRRVLEAVKLIESQGMRVVSAAMRVPEPRVNRARPRQVKKIKLHDRHPAQPENLPRLTWSEEMRRVLRGKEAGISYADLLAELVKGDLGKKRSAGDKGFYQAIRRLTNAGELVKSGGLLYTAQLAEALRRKGQPLPVRAGARGGSGAIILGILNEHPLGLSGPEIKDLAGKHPDSPRSMREHDQYIYNVLGALRGAGAILKLDNGKYRLATSHAGGTGTH